jgi:hypothetical protein
MPDQFENKEATKPEDVTVSEAAAENRIEHMAEKAAEKSTKTEHRYDRDHEIFSK